MKIVFMGTPDFAVKTLEKIIEKGHEAAAVVTQPDKPGKRSNALVMPPVKETALKYNLKVYQPAKIRGNEDFYKQISAIAPDVIVVVAFGQLLPPRILELPKYGCINVHASLLPEYRGAAPIQWAIIDGLAKTGVTTMQMGPGLDNGDIIMQSEVTIAPKETGGSLFEKLSTAGANLLVRTLEAVENKTAVRVKQDDNMSNYAQMLTKELGEIDFTKAAAYIERLIRGLNPWPSAYTHLDGKTLKIWDADVCAIPDEYLKTVPGEIFNITKDGFMVRCGMDALKINELQLEGKKRMSCDAFLRGYRLENGCVLD